MSEERYLLYDPFEYDEGEIACRKVRMVTTRKPQNCLDPWKGKLHEIPAGTRARFETALIDGSFWGKYYVCTACMDNWFKKVGIDA
jgi:hypothetical protein